MKTIRGASFKLKHTVYSDLDLLLPTNIIGATISVMFKKNIQDLDSDSLFTKIVGNGVMIIDGLNGLCETTVIASDTDSLSFDKLYFEVLVKTSNNEHIRSGIECIEVSQKLIKVLN